ncbi:MAG: universal stress protein [Actinomycetia bacterium]|nr:universal stress protein [Actinomycetes bacterium]
MTRPTQPTPTRVLIAIDSSPGSRRAIPVGSGLASAFDVPVSGFPVASDDQRRAEIEAVVATQHAELELEPGSDDSVSSGTVADLIATADRRQALVIAAIPSVRRRNRRARPFGYPMAATSPAPWLAVGPKMRRPRGVRPNQLVVPLDGSSAAAALVPTALSWARAFGLVVQLIAVVPSAPPPLRPPTVPNPRQRFTMDPEHHMSALLVHQPADAKVKTEVLPDPIGLASAMEHRLRDEPENIVLAPSRRGFDYRSFIDGASTDSLLRASPVPVLLVPDPPPPQAR